MVLGPNSSAGRGRGISPSLEIFQTRLATVLCSLLCVTLLGQGVGLGDPRGPCQPRPCWDSGILRADGIWERQTGERRYLEARDVVDSRLWRKNTYIPFALLVLTPLYLAENHQPSHGHGLSPSMPSSKKPGHEGRALPPARTYEQRLHSTQLLAAKIRRGP